MARVHVVANQKGGVGKTTVTVQLAAVVADTIGRRAGGAVPVLGVSTDPQASMLEWAQRVGAELPFDFEQCSDPTLLAQLRTVARYSHIFVDTPGTLEAGDALAAVLAQADDVIVPIEPEPLAFGPAAHTIRAVIAPARVPYRVLINNWDPRDGTVDRDQTREYLEATGFPSFATVIRHYKLHARASADGMTVVQYARNRVALEARQDFLKLALEVLGGAGRAARHAVNGVKTGDAAAPAPARQ